MAIVLRDCGALVHMAIHDRTPWNPASMRSWPKAMGVALVWGVVAGAALVVIASAANQSRRTPSMSMGNYWGIVGMAFIAGVIATLTVMASQVIRGKIRAVPIQQSTRTRVATWILAAGALALAIFIEVPLLGEAHVHGAEAACSHQGAPFLLPRGSVHVSQSWTWVPFGFRCTWFLGNGSVRITHLNWGDTYGAEPGGFTAAERPGIKVSEGSPFDRGH